MASKVQDELYEIFTALAGDQTTMPAYGVAAPDATGELQAPDIGGGLVARSVVEQLRDTVTRTTTTDSGDGAEKSASSILTSLFQILPSSGGGIADIVKQVEDGSSGGSTAGSIASKVLKSALGLVPLVSGRFRIFGGGDDEAAAPLVKYALPEAIDFQAAESGQGIASVDYDQMGRPRAYGSSDRADGGSAVSSPAGGAQITVNVQAMDARSFLDRSGDIAAAVREAMLNLNPINDVVSEL